jgi:hypothetical protein
MGAGGHAGLYLSEDMINGSSNPSETFDNEMLSAHEFFKVEAIEVWALI